LEKATVGNSRRGFFSWRCAMVQKIFFSGVPEGPRCELGFASLATRPFGHAAKKFRMARFDHRVLYKRS
jgi:hypothetical protein